MGGATSVRNAPKKTVLKYPRTHPPYVEMVKRAIIGLKDRNGSSREDILKYILANFELNQPITLNYHVKGVLRNGITKGFLKYADASSVGVYGRFKLGDNVNKAVKSSVENPRSPSTDKSPKKSVAKKPAVTKAAKKRAGSGKPKPAKKSPAKTVKKAAPKKKEGLPS